MRLAVISDIHGNLAALEAALDDIARRGITDIICLGDCSSGMCGERGRQTCPITH
jgi:predicted phosphodiesterase